ncbi:hypothetical protein GOD82_28610, partial [Sinorhizobium medicae]|nr:hypothetical protein [Sinorhizobium medicae]
SHRAKWRNENRRGSNRRWMKVQWQVTASGAIVIMLRQLKMHGMAQAVGEPTEQGSPAFKTAPNHQRRRTGT